MHRAHPITRRYFAEDLVRLRRAREKRRYAGSQRRGRIDPNPHQVEAVMFALSRIPDGGCILADEVGLGKTIEAGLVVAQLLAEGATRILIIVPRPLLGQWQDELYTLFAIEARDAGETADFSSPGVYLAGREWSGGERGAAELGAAPPFDLCIIDEAHEIFAGIHRRYDRNGVYLETSKHAQTAHRVRGVIGAAPVLLLTATPIQNSLAELWGLIQYVEPTSTLLGSLPTFKELFCADGDARRVALPQADELRRRMGTVVKRTLRRQAQEFLERPFVGRRAQLFEYEMSPDERSLYDDVTAYLLRSNTCAFGGRSRQLLLLGFHRRMASSTRALAQSLEGVARRLKGVLESTGADPIAAASEFLADLEEEEADVPLASQETDGDEPAAETLRAEIELVEDFVRRARSLPHDSKAESLLRAVQLVRERDEASPKVVVFTESLTTQDYLRDLLIEQGGLADQDITLFRGTNDSPRAREALRRWEQEVGPHLPVHAKPSASVATRLALVHEFKTRSNVLIATEAGAKGLNLQFCDTVINYDLPWNPQRIEQRIGRCHRYGQTHDVTVINFLARDNEAQRLTFDILSSKLDLFGEVLDMSDAVLHSPRTDRTEELATALGPDFELQLHRIWDRARSLDEVEAELRRLRDSVADRRRELEDMRDQTIGLIEGRLDEAVREVFRDLHETLPEALAELDQDLERVVTNYLDAIGVGYEHRLQGERDTIIIAPSPALPYPVSDGLQVALGGAHDLEEIEPLHLGHPLVTAAVEEARQAGTDNFRVRFELDAAAPDALQARRGARGRLALTRVSHQGFEREQRLVATALFDDSEVLRPAEAALELVQLPCEDVPELQPPLSISLADLDEVVDEELFFDQSTAAKSEQERFASTLDQLDQHVEDRALVLRRGREKAVNRLRKAEGDRDRALGPDSRAKAERVVQRASEEIEELDHQLEVLETRQDADYLRWKQVAHDRRYGPPTAERLLTVEFILA